MVHVEVCNRRKFIDMVEIHPGRDDATSKGQARLAMHNARECKKGNSFAESAERYLPAMSQRPTAHTSRARVGFPLLRRPRPFGCHGCSTRYGVVPVLAGWASPHHWSACAARSLEIEIGSAIKTGFAGPVSQRCVFCCMEARRRVIGCLTCVRFGLWIAATNKDPRPEPKLSKNTPKALSCPGSLSGPRHPPRSRNELPQTSARCSCKGATTS